MKNVTAKYVVIFFVSLMIGGGALFSQRYWMPEKYTQARLLESPVFVDGIQGNLLEIQNKIILGEYISADENPVNLIGQTYRGTIVKVPGRKTTIPYNKYKIDIQFLYPYSSISRGKKLGVILADVDASQTHEFADLFWNLK